MEELIVRSLQGRISSREAARLRRWRAASIENETSYRRFVEVWKVSGAGRTSRSHKPPAPGPTTIIKEAEAPRTIGTWGVRTMAAAAVIVLALGLGYLMGGHERGSEPTAFRSSEVVTGVGESSTTHLADGTVIRLGPESRLTIPRDPASREVRLDGTAFFAVASDSVAPFVVATSAGNARVLGTRFELSTRASDLRLVVVDGRVALDSGDMEVEVKGSEVSHISAGGTPTVTPVDDVWPLLAWMGGFLAFESTPLHEVGSELQERFGVNLVLDDPTLADETVTVWFGDEGIEQVATVLCRLVEASCTVEESSIVMRRTP